MYETIYRNFLSPLYENCLKKRNYLAYRKFLNDSQWWTKEKLLQFQKEELDRLLQHVYSEVPYWKKRFEKLQMTPEDIKSYDDFIKLPLITKEDIRNNRKNMVAASFEGKTWTKATGGSTGTPLAFEYTSDSYDWRMAASKRGYSWAGCEDGIKQAYIWGIAIGKRPFIHRIKEEMHHCILRQKYFNCFDFDEAKMVKVLESLNGYKPEIIIGYTNPLYNFTKFIKQSGKLKFKPKTIISAAEKLHDFQRKEIEGVFECKVFNTYGSREFMLIAADCSLHQGLHISTENLIVEILKEDGTLAEEGEMGEIVITDLHNYGMPFIRYKIGDMGVISKKVCPCGRGLPVLEDIVGRSLDMIRTIDGRYIPGEFFPHLMKEFTEIKQFQIVQDDLKTLRINIIKEKDISNEKLNFMKNEICKVVGKKITVNIDFVENIPLTKTGKFRVTMSKILPDRQDI